MTRKPQQARSRATVDAIVEAGLIVLAREGPENVTTRKIASVAGVGVGSLYEYFDNREAVYGAMFGRITKDAVARIRPLIPALVELPIREGIIRLLDAVRALLEENDGRYLYCLRHGMNLTRHYKLRPLERVLNELMMQYVLRHPELMRATNLAAMSYIFIYGGTFTLIHHLSDPESALGFDELAEGLADMVTSYMEKSAGMSL
jgi:AcrR family transcriptional regulator